jgi:hypothetical protein
MQAQKKNLNKLRTKLLKQLKKEEGEPTEMHVKGPSSRKKYVKRPVNLFDA